MLDLQSFDLPTQRAVAASSTSANAAEALATAQGPGGSGEPSVALRHNGRVVRRWNIILRLALQRVQTLIPSRPPRVIMWVRPGVPLAFLHFAEGDYDHSRTVWMRWRRVLARAIGVRSRYKAIDPLLRV